MQKIILASQSPRRKQLLEWAEIPFDVVVSAAEEDYPEALAIQEVPIYIARNKAIAVKQLTKKSGTTSNSSDIILAADTVVVLDNQIIGKPKDKTDAIQILTSLTGRSHQVITGVVILHMAGEIAFSHITTVHFHALTANQIEYYIDKYRPYDKAGAYAIQEWIGVVGIKSVEGDFYNVMGLPVSKVVQELDKLQSAYLHQQ